VENHPGKPGEPGFLHFHDFPKHEQANRIFIFGDIFRYLKFDTMRTTALPLLLFSLFLFPVFLSAQGYCDGDKVIFTEPAHQVDYDDVVYKTAVQIDELDPPIMIPIRLRVYFPTDLPAGEKRPLIVLVHGGYFICGCYNDFFAFAESLAKKGFIAATVEYRRCRRNDCLFVTGSITPPSCCNFVNSPCLVSWNNSFLPSAYVATVDVNDAIRWLQQNADQYQIDPEKVVVAGHSAGAYTALNVAFLDQSEIQTVLPMAGTWPDYMAENLDPVDGIRACITMSGAFFDLDWMEQAEVIGENIAVGIVHGTSDGVVGYGEDVAIPCCQTYNTTVYGGCEIAKRVEELGGNFYLLTGEGFGHDIGESPWFDSIAEQVPAFVVKTVLCEQNIEKHSVVSRVTPLPMCPNNVPNLPPAPVCDVESVTPGIPVPVKEIPGARSVEAISLVVFPTITDGQIQVKTLSPEADGAWRVSVFSTDGRLVKQVELELRESAMLDLGELPPGIYGLFFQSKKDGKYGTVRVQKM
jgi:predicted esterase